jgi:hypothetical protein
MCSETADTSKIGTLNEKPLHAALKEWYARPGDRLEVNVDGFVIDIVRGDQLVEIQTGHFSAVKHKLTRLVERYPLRLVYPVAGEKWLVKLPKEPGGRPERRKSPKRGRVEEVFKELVSLAHLVGQDHFSLEVLLVQEEEVRRYAGPRKWRKRGWVTVERRLLDVVERHLFVQPDDLAAMIPKDLPDRFTTADLAAHMGGPRWLAQKAAYCLRTMGVLVQIGQRGRSNLYRMTDAAQDGTATQPQRYCR